MLKMLKSKDIINRFLTKVKDIACLFLTKVKDMSVHVSYLKRQLSLNFPNFPVSVSQLCRVDAELLLETS